MLISPAISVSAPKVASVEDEVAVCLSRMDLAKADEEVSCGGGAIKRAEPVGKVSAAGSVVVAEPDLAADKEAAVGRLHQKRKGPGVQTGRKMVKKRVRVRQEAIDMLLRDPPADPINPEEFDHMPEVCKPKFFRAIAFLNRLKADEWDVLYQYHTKGYAEIDSYVYEDEEEAQS